jgi:hypothetical protein
MGTRINIEALLVIGAFVCVLIGCLMCFLFLASLISLLNPDPEFGAVEIVWLGLFTVVAFAPAFMLSRRKSEPHFIGLVEVIIIGAFAYCMTPRL